MIQFPRSKCYSRERDKETGPSKTEVETMARAGALCVSVCLCLCGHVCVWAGGAGYISDISLRFYYLI